MFTITITERGGQPVVQQFDQAEVTIGRVSGNDIVLAKSNVSKRHARIIHNDGAFVVVDTKSTNGTYVDGHRIDAPFDLQGGETISIGDHILQITPNAGASAQDAADQHEARSTRDTTDEPSLANIEKESAPPKPSFGDDPSPEDIAFALSHFDVPDEDQPSEPDEFGADAPADNATSLPALIGGKAIAPLEEFSASSETPPPIALMGPEHSQPAASAPAPMSPSTPAVVPATTSAPAAVPIARIKPVSAAAAAPMVNIPETGTLTQAQLIALVQDRLRSQLAIFAPATHALTHHHSRQKISELVRELVAQLEIDGRLEPIDQPDTHLRDVIHAALRMGPLDQLLWDDSVRTIQIQGTMPIRVVRQRMAETTDLHFDSVQALQHALQPIIAQHAGASHAAPQLSLALEDGSQLHLINAPMALLGPLVTVHKKVALAASLTLDALVAAEALSPEMAQFLSVCVQGRKNIVISGSTYADTSTVLVALLPHIPATDATIWLSHIGDAVLNATPYISQLQTPTTSQHRADSALHTAYAMRPHRLIVSECGSHDITTLLTAMAADCEGSIATLQAQAPRDVLSRLETWALLSDATLSTAAAKQLVSAAVDLVIHVMRFTDGSQRIVRISEIVPAQAGGGNDLQDIFAFRHRGFDAQGAVQGSFRATGVTPKFYQILRATGLAADPAIFKAT